MNSDRCFLFTLEVTPLVVGHTYDTLPLHCTLIHRFLTEIDSSELSEKFLNILIDSETVVLEITDHRVLGPNNVQVSIVKTSNELNELYARLFNMLNLIGVRHITPQWTGNNHIFHITDRENEPLQIGSKITSNAVYLIEIIDHKRVIRNKFILKSHHK